MCHVTFSGHPGLSGHYAPAYPGFAPAPYGGYGQFAAAPAPAYYGGYGAAPAYGGYGAANNGIHSQSQVILPYTLSTISITCRKLSQLSSLLIYIQLIKRIIIRLSLLRSEASEESLKPNLSRNHQPSVEVSFEMNRLILESKYPIFIGIGGAAPVAPVGAIAPVAPVAAAPVAAAPVAPVAAAPVAPVAAVPVAGAAPVGGVVGAPAVGGIGAASVSTGAAAAQSQSAVAASGQQQQVRIFFLWIFLTICHRSNNNSNNNNNNKPRK